MNQEKHIKNELIKDFCIKELGFDFMGYTFEAEDELSFHHLIVPKRKHGETSYNNGSVLVRNTSHNYIHTIEKYDEELFSLITNEIIKEKNEGKISTDNLKKIRSYLEYFESDYINKRTNKGNLIITENFIRKRIKID